MFNIVYRSIQLIERKGNVIENDISNVIENDISNVIENVIENALKTATVFKVLKNGSIFY